MNRRVPFILLICLSYLPVSSQFKGTDTLFRADELIFFSTFEREAFNDFLSGDPDYLAMMAAVDPGTDERELGLYRDWINDVINKIREKKFDQLSKENKIDRIKKYVSKSLLLNYEFEADFADLFINGDYNYFTAAALYAFIFDQFGIPIEIHEVPTHIYLVAWPGEEDIPFETTPPGFQFFMFDHDTRTNFVEFMHSQGVIDDQSYKNTPTRDLFQQYFFTHYGLTIREMIGMLYINSALDLTMKDLADDSYAQMEKAFILYPSYKTQFMLLVQLNRYILKMDYRNLAQLGYLIKASRLVGYGVDRDMVERYLADIVDKVLVDEEDYDGFEYIYEYLQVYIRDENLKKSFQFRYLYERGKMEYLNTRYAKALDYLESAYLIRPDDEALQDLLARSLGGYSLMVGPGLVLEKIHHYDSSFTGVADEGIYLLVKLQTYLGLFGEAFQLQNRQTGEQFMAGFEQLMDDNPGAGIDNFLIGRSYSSAAIYYYRQGKVEKSKQVIEKGLMYAPDNIELKLKLASFK